MGKTECRYVAHAKPGSQIALGLKPGVTVVQFEQSIHRGVDFLLKNHVTGAPVVDPEGRPVGMIDITDVVGLLPRDAAAAAARCRSSSHTPTRRAPGIVASSERYVGTWTCSAERTPIRTG